MGGGGRRVGAISQGARRQDNEGSGRHLFYIYFQQSGVVIHGGRINRGTVIIQGNVLWYLCLLIDYLKGGT